MNKDILFKTDDYVFSYRVAGILVQDGKVLLQRALGDSGYALPGGHVSFGETNAETLIREFKEELNVEIEVGNLKWVGENFFPWDERRCHQINLFYEVNLRRGNAVPLCGSFYGVETLEDHSFKLEFSWIELCNIPNLELYPVNVKKLLVNDSGRVEHFVYREDD